MPIQHKRNTSAGVAPTTASLAIGELGINVADGKLFGRRSGSAGDTIVTYLASDITNTGSFTISGSATIVGPTTHSGSLIISGLPATSSIDVSGNNAVYANNATVDFPNFSGMILFNNTTTTGVVTLVLCGGGVVSVLGASNATGGTGSFSGVSGINGYRWTNNTGGAISASFVAIRTRTAI